MHESHDTLDLILGHTEGGLTADQFDTLQQRLRDNAEARQLYRDTIDRAVHLRSILKANSERRTRNAERRQITSPSVPRSEFGVPSFLAAAALLALAATAWFVFQPEPQTLNPEPSTPASTTPIATLIDAAPESTVLAGNDIAPLGTDIPARTVSIESGHTELLLTSRVGIKLTGRTSLTMHSDMSATLIHGRAEFHCPPGAEGYTVHLPGGAKVVDLGTRFVVSTNARRDEVLVRVLDGRVRLVPSNETQSIVLSKLEARRLDVSGRVHSVPPMPYGVAYESFDYPAGQTLAGLGGIDHGFAGAWSGDTGTRTTETGLSLPSDASPLGGAASVEVDADFDRVIRRLETPVDFDADGVCYVSFLVRKADSAPTQDALYVELRDATEVKAAFGISSGERAMIITHTVGFSGDASFTDDRLPNDQTLRLVGRIRTAADDIDTYDLSWFAADRPVPDEEPTQWDLARRLSADTIGGAADHLAITARKNTRFVIDEVRIGPTWNDVLPQSDQGNPVQSPIETNATSYTKERKR